MNNYLTKINILNEKPEGLGQVGVKDNFLGRGEGQNNSKNSLQIYENLQRAQLFFHKIQFESWDG